MSVISNNLVKTNPLAAATLSISRTEELVETIFSMACKLKMVNFQCITTSGVQQWISCPNTVLYSFVRHKDGSFSHATVPCAAASSKKRKLSNEPAANDLTPDSASHDVVEGDLTVEGNLNVGKNVTASRLLTWSDVRLKKNIDTLTDALTIVRNLRGVSYNWKAEGQAGQPSQKVIGVIAQEVEKHIPEIVKTNSDGFKSVEYSALTPFLIEAIKQLYCQVEHNQQEVEQLCLKLTGSHISDADVGPSEGASFCDSSSKKTSQDVSESDSMKQPSSSGEDGGNHTMKSSLETIVLKEVVPKRKKFAQGLYEWLKPLAAASNTNFAVVVHWEADALEDVNIHIVSKYDCIAKKSITSVEDRIDTRTVKAKLFYVAEPAGDLEVEDQGPERKNKRNQKPKPKPQNCLDLFAECTNHLQSGVDLLLAETTVSVVDLRADKFRPGPHSCHVQCQRVGGSCKNPIWKAAVVKIFPARVGMNRGQKKFVSEVVKSTSFSYFIT